MLVFFFLNLIVDECVFEKVSCSGDKPSPVGFTQLEVFDINGVPHLFCFGGQFRNFPTNWNFVNSVFFLNLGF